VINNFKIINQLSAKNMEDQKTEDRKNFMKRKGSSPKLILLFSDVSGSPKETGGFCGVTEEEENFRVDQCQEAPLVGGRRY
jgi:hypothetical protein